MKLQKLTLCTAISAAILASTGVAAKTELEVASWKGAGAEVAEFPAMIAKFEEQNPDIKVKLTYMARNDMMTSIPARMQAGNPPDVVMVDREYVMHWGGNGQLKTLNEQPFVERIQPALRPSLGFDGDVYYSMLELSGMGVYTNDDLLAKAGITSYPQTIDELVVACGKLNDKGIQPMLMAANNGGWTPFVYFLSMGMAEGNTPDPMRIDKALSGEKPFAGDPAMENAFEGMRKMLDAKCFDAKISAGTDPWSVALTTFQSGRVAMLPQGMWNINPFLNDTLPEQFTFHPFSAINGDKGISMAYNGPGWAIPTAAKDVEAAEKWIDFWMDNDNLPTFLVADTGITTLIDGDSGVPSVADPFVEALSAGQMVTFPVGTIPAQLGIDMPNDITSFMLDPTQDYKAILKRWDAVTEKERG